MYFNDEPLLSLTLAYSTFVETTHPSKQVIYVGLSSAWNGVLSFPVIDSFPFVAFVVNHFIPHGRGRRDIKALKFTSNSRSISPLRDDRHLCCRSSIALYSVTQFFAQSIFLSRVGGHKLAYWYLPEKHGSCIFAAVVLPEIISKEREQSTINGSAVVGHSLTAQEHETVWRVSWSGSGESRSTAYGP